MRILGVEVPDKKNVHIALSGSIYGIGLTSAMKICKVLNIDCSLKIKELDEEKIGAITKYIEENLKVEGALKASEREFRRRLMAIQCYRGSRLSKGLPRNSRTKTNSKTARLLKKRLGEKTRKK